MTAAGVLVACPACNALNRVPQARLGDAPNCGKCAAPLFAGHPLALDAAGGNVFIAGARAQQVGNGTFSAAEVAGQGDFKRGWKWGKVV